MTRKRGRASRPAPGAAATETSSSKGTAAAGRPSRQGPAVPTRGRPVGGARRRTRWLAGLGVLGSIALVAWWWWRPAISGERPDVLLVTIDTLRADRVGCYGYRAAATPVLDRLAAEGVRFDEAIATVPLTLPSHASILTGVTPLVHGVRDNAGFVLGTAPRTIAEAFRDADYETAAFVSAFPVHHRFGLARGFETYDDRFPRGDDPARPPYVERRADGTIAAAVTWLKGRSASPASARSPVFVWVHLFDPHAPYDAPDPEGAAFRDRPYDGEIAFTDRQLGLLLDAWRSLRGGRQPVLAVTADHGEGLGQHGEPTHGLFIYDSTIRVPLLLAGPGVPAGTTVRGAVSLIDVAPTLADLAGLGPLAGIEGRSLRGSLTSGRAPAEAAYTESLFGLLGFGWAPLYGWRERGIMLIDAPRVEMYDIRADPTQSKNLAADRTEDMARLRRVLKAAVAKAPVARAGELSRDTAERLRSLGYVASGQEPRPSLHDPKDVAALAVRIENAIAIERADPARAADEFRAALKEDPASAVVRRHLAMALVAGGQHEAAARELHALLAAGDDTLETLTLLGDCQRLLGRYADALVTFERAVAANRDVPEGYGGQGKVLTALGRPDEARQAFERALRVSPDDADALESLADLALARGDAGEAANRLSALAARDPGDSRIALKHGVALVRSGQFGPAIEVFRGVAVREPANAEAALDLAGALAKAGRPAEAVPWFERAIGAGASGTVVWNGLAMARLQSGNQAGAVQALRASLSAKPDQPHIRELLVRIEGSRQ